MVILFWFFFSFFKKLQYNHFCWPPKWYSGKESACQFKRCKRHRFSLWVGKILWSRKWQPTPIFLPVKFHDRGAWQAIVRSVTESDDLVLVRAHTHIHTTALQCCVSYSNTTMWISYMHAYISSLLGLPPTYLGRHSTKLSSLKSLLRDSLQSENRRHKILSPHEPSKVLSRRPTLLNTFKGKT